MGGQERQFQEEKFPRGAHGCCGARRAPGNDLSWALLPHARCSGGANADSKDPSWPGRHRCVQRQVAPGRKSTLSACHGQGQRLGVIHQAAGAVPMSQESSVFSLNLLLPSGSCTCRGVQGEEQAHGCELLLGSTPCNLSFGAGIWPQQGGAIWGWCTRGG